MVHNIVMFFRGFFFVGEQFDSWPLWYLLSQIYALFLILILIKLIKSKKKIIYISVLIWLIASCTKWICTSNPPLPGIMNSYRSIISKIFINGRVFTGIGYLAVGMLISSEKAKSNKRYLTIDLCILFCGAILTKYVVRDIIIFVLVTVIFRLCVSCNKENEFSKKIRKVSTVTYFTHMIFFFMYTTYIGSLNKYGIDSFIISLISTWVVAMLVNCTKDNRIVKFIFS